MLPIIGRKEREFCRFTVGHNALFFEPQGVVVAHKSF